MNKVDITMLLGNTQLLTLGSMEFRLFSKRTCFNINLETLKRQPQLKGKRIHRAMAKPMDGVGECQPENIQVLVESLRAAFRFKRVLASKVPKDQSLETFSHTRCSSDGEDQLGTRLCCR